MRQLYIEVCKPGTSNSWSVIGPVSNPTPYEDRTIAKLCLQQIKDTQKETRTMRVIDRKTGQILAKVR